MRSRSLTPDMRDFIYRFVPSVLALEALLLLQSDATGRWTAARLVDSLPELTTKSAQDLLAQFHWHGFLVAGPDHTFTYQPESVELGTRADSLAKLCAERPAVVLAEIAGQESRASIRHLAEAFRLRRRRRRG